MPYVLFSYRSAVQATTGYAPKFLIFKWEPHLPSDVQLHLSEKQIQSDQTFQFIDLYLRQAQYNIIQRQKRQQKNHEKKRKIPCLLPKRFDLAFFICHKNKKFIFHWLGPYQINKLFQKTLFWFFLSMEIRKNKEFMSLGHRDATTSLSTSIFKKIFDMKQISFLKNVR